MKYANGKDIFPPELLDIIQDYTQGKCVYIPKRDENKDKWGTRTSYKRELNMRNSHIHTGFLTGLSVKQLSKSYCLSEKSIRRILFLKRKEALTMRESIINVLKQWNLNEDIHQVYNTTWSVGDDFIIKISDSLDSLKRNIVMMKTLDEYGIPVAHPISTTSGKDYIEYNGKFYLLMNKLEGIHVLDIYNESYKDIAYDTGKIVAKLHSAFIACEQSITFWNNSLLDEMNGWVHNILNENKYRYITESDYEESLNELKESFYILPRQLIHRDLHYGNILFIDGEFSGYVDFDLSQKNIRIFDICYFLIGLLVGREKNREDVEKWFFIVTKFIQGYEETNQLLKAEKDNICCVMKNIELLFVAYFQKKQDDALAESAANMFYFIKNNEPGIKQAIHNSSNMG
jgi:Putative homoserine kinase type II (protein kinase fold)